MYDDNYDLIGIDKAIASSILISFKDNGIDECIKCKLTDCIEVCPVDCFYEGENMVVINPDECIDCGVCEPECPIDAIKADTDDSVKDKEKWLELNKKYSAIWPNISKKKEPMDEHEKFRNIKDKYDKHFSEKPGK